VVFEDSLVGVHAARSAGMRVVGVTTAHDSRELLAAGAERASPTSRDSAWSREPP
jgi:beta-phosphoglucomutase-like phosphatase (HAD superfamily)